MYQQARRQIHGQRGFSLIELMVAIVIGLIIMAGVIQVVVSSKVVFLQQEDMSFIQENARYAMDVIGRDIQSAGHWGCAGSDAEVAQVARVKEEAAPLLGVQPLRGFAGATAAPFPAVYRDRLRMPDFTTTRLPDSFVVRRAEGAVLAVTDHSGAQLQVTPAHSFDKGEYLAVVGENCRSLGIIRLGEVSDGSTIDYSGQVCTSGIRPSLFNPVICDAQCNCVGNTSLSQLYQPGSSVMKFAARAYYIGESTALAGQPALKRAVLFGGEGTERGALDEEIALGVEDMNLSYGVDNDNDGRPNQYLRADQLTEAQWADVRAVQVTLVLRAAAPSQQVDPATSVYGDRYVRQTVTSTFRLRNSI